MSDLIIKEDPSQYPVPDETLHNAVLVDAVALGKIDTPWGPKEKVSLIFELETEDENGKQFIVGKRFTKSLNEKSSLRKFLEKWRAKTYTTEELQKGINLEDLIGLNATILIVHHEKEDRTYANVESILPHKNSRGKPAPVEQKPSGEYVRVIERDGYLKPEEYAESVNGSK